MVGIIALCYLIELFIAPVDWSSAAIHTVMPQIADAEALLLAVGIIGATVMPHAVYLHSGLTQARTPVRNADERRMVLRFSNQEVIIALTIAGMVNMAAAPPSRLAPVGLRQSSMESARASRARVTARAPSSPLLCNNNSAKTNAAGASRRSAMPPAPAGRVGAIPVIAAALSRARVGND